MKVSTGAWRRLSGRANDSGNIAPGLLTAVGALILGYLAFTFLPGNESSETPAETASNAADAEAMAALQESLQTSLALPADFKSIKPFSLLGTDGEAIDESVFDDQWSMVFFGFTHCPDVCPITLQVLKEVVTTLEAEEKAAPQVVFVSVDPVRDTAPKMKQYLNFFDEDFVGITGDVNAVHDMTSSLGIVAAFTANDSDPDSYGVDHTASLLLIDPQGRVRAKVTPPHKTDAIMADYLAIVDALG